MAMIQDALHFSAAAAVGTAYNNSLDFGERGRQKISYRLLEALKRVKGDCHSMISLHFAPMERCLTQESCLVDIRRRSKDGKYFTDESFFMFLVPLLEKVRDYAEHTEFDEEMVKFVVMLYLHLTEIMSV